MQMNGFGGETYCDDSVWFVKTHYPCYKKQPFNAGNVICCVRNPMDVITSLWNFWATQTHTKSVKEQDFHKKEGWIVFVQD